MIPRSTVGLGVALLLWLWLAGAAASEVAAGMPRFAAPGQTRPNFLLLLSDDQTYRALGLLGELPVQTPNLDRLAKRGLTFTHCFNQGASVARSAFPAA